MNLRKGFTLIELLIVVTIIAILAGAAIPYVQDYIEESRRSRAKNDLDEIRNALVLYEVNRRETYRTTNIASLVGPFLTKAMNDPWGAQYGINNASSVCYSVGPDGVNLSGDEIYVEFRPRMAVTKIYWIDGNLDGLVSFGDSLHFYTTRVGTYGPTGNISASNLVESWNGTIDNTPAATGWLPTYRIASFGFSGATVPTPGSDTVRIDPFGSTDNIKDQSNAANQYAKQDLLRVVAP